MFGYPVLGLGAGMGDAAAEDFGDALRVAAADGLALAGALADGAAETSWGDAIAGGTPDGLAASGALAAGTLGGGANLVEEVARLPELPAQAATTNAMAIVHPIPNRTTPIRIVLPA